MRFLLDIDVAEDKSEFAQEFFKTISFVKNVKVIESNQITNPAILQSIEDYEINLVQPTPMSLDDLKVMINA